jgi:hypothetical protein
MGFQRNHIDEITRISIGVGVYLNKGVYGYISEMARKYIVSRWFIYYCYFQVILLLDIQKRSKYSSLESYKVCVSRSVEEMVLALYLDCESSISGIERAIRDMYGKRISEGQISEILNKKGSMLDKGERVNFQLSIVSDEIFGHSDSVLVVVEPLSGYILRLELVKNHDKETWGVCWLDIVNNETGLVEKIIADQGKGIVGGIGLLFSEDVYRSDLFHVMIRLGYWLGVLERKAYSSIEKEESAKVRFKKVGSKKLLKEYKTATFEVEKMIGLYEDYEYLFRELQNTLLIVNMKSGELRDKKEVISEVETIFSLMEEIDYEGIKEGVKYFRRHQEEVLRYFDDVKKADIFLKDRITESIVKDILVLIYAYQQQVYTAYGERKQKLESEIALDQEALVQYLGKEEYERLSHLVNETLSSIIRSSSIVENTNSRLRRFFDSARGQINQNRLNLIRFYLNHKPFDGSRRKGKSPAQIFYNQYESAEDWLSILRKIRTEKLSA